MFNAIAQKIRLSYFIFTAIVCVSFVSIFLYAGIHVEQALVKGRLLEELNSSRNMSGIQSHYSVEPGIDIYQFAHAPLFLQARATDTVQEMQVTDFMHAGRAYDGELHFFTYTDGQTRYILTYLLSDQIVLTNYPVLATYEDFEALFFKTLLGAVALSFLIAIAFAYVSAHQITKPLSRLKHAVETDNENLGGLLHLPSEVGVLARVIDTKNRKLADYLQREQLFTGDVSHELRTPLTIIMGAAEVLEAQLPTDSRQREFTHRIHSTATETSEIISALLMLSRAPEKLDAPITPLRPIIEHEVSRLDHLIKYKDVRCELLTDKDYSAHARPELLKMAIGNLIKNAFQYTDTGTVSIYVDVQTITIDDTGSGIEDTLRPQLFARFERGNAEGIDGSGLGLSIVQRIIQHLGWEITYQPNIQGGSTFIITYY
ncbi:MULTISPECIES: sensor histidine kinase [unclassified Psychrobacter]|uniref:sensor histidine kinase n=1 Tax=unclassified Psychrobacter TaxID=196806 RepID=UPI0018F3C679|nr:MULTISPECIES: HAMP domain-containing sensor histidine kinase [unclassified Psychrobacter]